MRGFRNFAAWPMPNSAPLADLMTGASDEIVQLHKDRKALITDHLSTLVLEATGPLMFHEMSAPAGPVLWLNHDVIASFEFLKTKNRRIHFYFLLLAAWHCESDNTCFLIDC